MISNAAGDSVGDQSNSGNSAHGILLSVHAKRERYRDRACRVCIGLLTAGDLRPPSGKERLASP